MKYYHYMKYSYLHEVLLQQAVHPGLSHLHGPHLVGDVTALDQDHLQLGGRSEVNRRGEEGVGTRRRRGGERNQEEERRGQ